MKKGMRVRFTMGNLGVMETPRSTRFMSGALIQVGDEGNYHGEMELCGYPGWHLIAVEGGFVPVHESQFEIIVTEEVAA